MIKLSGDGITQQMIEQGQGGYNRGKTLHEDQVRKMNEPSNDAKRGDDQSNHMPHHGDRLKILMEKENISIKELADTLDKGRTTVYGWLMGSDMSEKAAREVAAHFKVHPAWLRYGVRPMDYDLLQRVTELVETISEKKGLRLPPKQKAKVVSITYRRLQAGDSPSAAEMRLLAQELIDLLVD